MSGIVLPAVAEGESEVARLQARVRQLEKINAALMDRVERSIDMEGGAFSMFETAIALESVVRDRTSALENAMSELNRVIAELAAANEDATA
ncbi:MAG: hybrid sensor histidine kinase/response regulator, partial [Novosphingobium sp.]